MFHRKENNMKKRLTLLSIAMIFALALGSISAYAADHKLGLMLYGEADEATISIRTGFEKACEENGVDLEVYSIEQDYSKCPTYLQMFFDSGCDMIVDATWSADAGLLTEATCKEEGIPLFTCDVEYSDYAHLVGANSYEAGRTNGQYITDWVNEHWDGEVNYILCLYPVFTGEGVKQRLTGAVEVLGENGLWDKGEDGCEWFDSRSTEEAYKYVTDWLQGNPDATHVFIIGNNDSMGLGQYNAVEQMERQDDCIVSSFNCDSFALEHFAATEEGDPWLASCNFNLSGYGDLAVPALIEIVESGEDNIEHELTTQTFMVDRSNVAEFLSAE